MDTKWKKWKNRISFLLFFVGISLLVVSAARAGYHMKKSNHEIGQSSFASLGYQTDYQELDTFYRFINERIENYLMIANGTYYDWSVYDYEDYEEYSWDDNSIPYSTDFNTIVQELGDISLEDRDEFLYELENGYYQSYSNISEEKRKQMAENYLKYTKDDLNLLYQIVKDGKVLYTNMSSVYKYGDILPEGYNYIMHFDGEKVHVTKDGKEIDVYGDGVYNDNKDYIVPGYMNYKTDESLKNVNVTMILIKKPVEYRSVGNMNGYEYHYSEIYSIYKDMLNSNASQKEILCYGIISLTIFLSSLFLLKSIKEERRAIAVLLNKVWMEVKIIPIIVILILFQRLAKVWYNGYWFSDVAEAYVESYETLYTSSNEVLENVLFMLLANPLLYLLLFWGMYFLVLDISKNYRNKQNGIIINLVRSLNDRSLKMNFTKRLIRRHYLFILMCALAFVMILFSVSLSTYSGDKLICMFLLVIAIIILFSASSWYCKTTRAQASDLDMLCGQIQRISLGEYELEKMPFTGQDFVQTEQHLLNIQNGIRTAVDNQLMSERMKVDLVANVSHDLKTPLTSIISYIQFLKEENFPDHVKDYIRILDEKSARLNEMVQDVFSISKATSGQLPVRMEKLDFGKLLNQTLADMEETIMQSSINIKADIHEHKFYIVADGQRMYRVCQNLIQNALKYSLEGSRMYISLEQQLDRAIAIFKNTSKEELDQEIDFTGRFVRGDKSRTDGGSGLGLSIAQSFTEACGGQFTISINGDMFIVTISFVNQN